MTLIALIYMMFVFTMRYSAKQPENTKIWIRNAKVAGSTPVTGTRAEKQQRRIAYAALLFIGCPGSAAWGWPA
ncbi:hypothetical protein [Aeromonas dhakensis]|uniref:hypothetical protein n=1 Tax=Aeromonas dhakensis TaxID=196024 RepID=UPI002B470234|nr:hypothetical protein [Aeromonas dhakensis]